MFKDFEIGLPSKLPSKKDDLFCFSFNFENLIKTIDYLHKYNLALFSKLQNFNERMLKFEEIANEFPKIKEEIQNLKLYSKEHENLIKENQNKINVNNNKINDLSKKIEKNKINIEANEEMINENKNNIDILLKDKAEKEKKLAEEEKNQNNQNDGNINKKSKINFDEIKKYITENVFKGANDKDIELLKDNVNTINEKIKEIQINIDSSQNQMERNISNILNSMLNKDMPYQSNMQGKNMDGNLFKMTMAQIEKNKKYTQDMMDQFSTAQEKLKHDVAWLNNDLSESKKNYQNLQNIVDEYLEDKRYFLTFKDIKDITKNLDILISQVKEFLPKSDLETFKIDFNIKFQKITSKLRELDDFKNKQNQKKNNDEWNPEDLNFVPVTKRISELVSDLLKSEGKNIDLTKNKHFIELMKLNQQNSTELNKNMKNYINLKTLISSSLSQSDVDQIKKEIVDIKKDFKIYKNKIKDIIKLIGGFDNSHTDDKVEKLEKEVKQGDDNIEIKIKQNEETIKGKIEFITEYIEDLSDKLMKAEKKINSLTKDLKDDMKANLRLDTYKVVEQFKLKLNSFTDKFENELKNKIDKMGLNVFENKLNSKLSIEFKDKLNKNDLKKNNFMINRKIDTLENKISKTLVDTIIDLQMDDAPLLLKKNQRNVELCASCNRPLNDNNLCSKTIEHIPTHTSNNFMITPRRTHIRNIASLKKLPVIPNSPK